MLRALFVIGLAGPVLFTTPVCDDDDAPPTPESLGKLYADNCASCHQPPDTRFAVDRAWITQLADTA